jgi:hypothetical protein
MLRYPRILEFNFKCRGRKSFSFSLIPPNITLGVSASDVIGGVASEIVLRTQEKM